jgi:RNA polymerase sigma-70 factor (ECF subfamily)
MVHMGGCRRLNLLAAGGVFTVVSRNVGQGPSRRNGMPLDEDVVASIYRDHGAALRRFVLSASHDPQLAEDVVQETVLRVWQHTPEITGSLRSYLYRTARNIMIDNYRRARRRPAETLESGLTEPGAVPEKVDELLNRVLVEEALLRLSKEHRDVLVALHYRRFTVNEAAVQLNIPSGTVKSRAYYAVRALRTILDEMGVER